MTIKAWNAKPHCRYISSCGGTRSGKTFSILQLLYLARLGEEKRKAPPTITSIVSESFPHLKRGCIRDFKTMLQTEEVWDESRWSESNKTYTFGNGSIIEFFSIDNAGKVYGASRDDLFVNEAQHIPYETARQLFVRTRGRIILDYNPTHEFWAMTKIENQANCVRIHSTYKDNNHLTPLQVREIESNVGDKNWWRVFGEGEVGSLDGLIYSFNLIDELPKVSEFDRLQTIHGLDFGFTNDPTARVRVLADKAKKELYIREECYQTHLLNKHIIADLQKCGVDNRMPIYADCAEPKTIAEIREAGFNVMACDKDAPVRSDKLKFQLLWMQGWKLNVTKDSLNLINELRNYTWDKDKDGNLLNQPIDKYNHLLDALRYAVWTHFGERGSKNKYTLSVKRM